MNIPARMATDLPPQPGKWTLLVGPRSLNDLLLTAIARLGAGSAVRVLDGGNRFNAYKVARAARGSPQVLGRISVARAFTCHQVHSLLEAAAAGAEPVVILDLLSTFHDENVPLDERRRLLRACIAHLARLARGHLRGSLLVSVHPPSIPLPQDAELLELLEAAAGDVHHVEEAAPPPQPERLF